MEGGSLLISHEKYFKDGKVLDHLGFQSKVFPGPLADLRYLTLCCGIEVQKPTQVLKSVKGPGNIFDFNPK
jgi:hypothetical protein